MTPEEKYEYAESLIRHHAFEIEFLSVSEMAEEDYPDATQQDLEDVYNIVMSAEIDVQWRDE